MKEGMQRLQMDLAESHMALLDELRRETGACTRAEVMRTAIRFLAWAELGRTRPLKPEPEPEQTQETQEPQERRCRACGCREHTGHDCRGNGCCCTAAYSEMVR